LAMQPLRRPRAWHLLALLLRLGARGEEKSQLTRPLKDMTDEIDLQETCESCLSKGGGWCTLEQRCVDDDTAFCEPENLIGLAGFSNSCLDDPERTKPKSRPWIDKGVLVMYPYENGTCCMGLGIVGRAYHVLEEYSLLLYGNGSKEEVKTERWHDRKPGKKEDENSEYHNIEFRYFRPSELAVVSGIRPGDLVQAHFAVKTKAAQTELVMSKATEEAKVINTTVETIAVNFTADYVVSVLPRSFVVDDTNLTRSAGMITHEEL